MFGNYGRENSDSNVVRKTSMQNTEPLKKQRLVQSIPMWAFRPSEILEEQLNAILKERTDRGERISKQKLLEELVIQAVEMKMGGLKFRR